MRIIAALALVAAVLALGAPALASVNEPNGIVVPVDSRNGEQQLYTFFAAQGETYLQGAIVDIDDETGRARSIARVQERLPE